MKNDDDEHKDSGATSQEVSVEEYNILAKRIDSMESSVGFALAKV